MSFTFQLPKVVQEVGVLLDEAGGRFNYTKLLKMLYLADRESIAERGHPISGDDLVVMPKGPILSRVCDLMRGTGAISEDQEVYWELFFATSRWDLVRKKPTGTGRLSNYEVNKLQAVFREHKGKTIQEWFQFVDNLPEVKKHKPTTFSKRLPLTDIVDALGLQDKLPQIEQRRKEDHLLAEIFGN